jgi:hypothetical protein
MDATSLEVHGYDGSSLCIDAATGTVIGDWVPIPGKAETRLDFLPPAELCRCCARELLRSGSRFSVWFCARCAPMVRELNAQAGRCVIPIGRHTIMNGVGTKPAREWHREDIEDFFTGAQGLFHAIERLEGWVPVIVRAQCEHIAGGAGDQFTLGRYLDLVAERGIASAEAFELMLGWWSSR